MKTSKRIIHYLKEKNEASANELTQILEITERAVFKQLSKLLTQGAVVKIGTPPKVYYKLAPTIQNDSLVTEFPPKIEEVIKENFLYVTPLGEYWEGIAGFLRWCRDRNFNSQSQAKQYVEIITTINHNRKDGLFEAKQKFSESFTKSYLDQVYYADFYAIPQFGKTKLGQLLLYAKQSQDKRRIREISAIVKPIITKLINRKDIEAVGFIPPTIKREVQFMKELARELSLKVPIIKLTKLKTDVIVPQKTLSKLEDRIINARNTIIIEEARHFESVLLIDDAVGSGATLNETARKLKENGIAQKVYGMGIVGSYKGFDVISEV